MLCIVFVLCVCVCFFFSIFKTNIFNISIIFITLLLCSFYLFWGNKTYLLWCCWWASKEIIYACLFRFAFYHNFVIHICSECKSNVSCPFWRMKNTLSFKKLLVKATHDQSQNAPLSSNDNLAFFVNNAIHSTGIQLAGSTTKCILLSGGTCHRKEF